MQSHSFGWVPLAVIFLAAGVAFASWLGAEIYRIHSKQVQGEPVIVLFAQMLIASLLIALGLVFALIVFDLKPPHPDSPIEVSAMWLLGSFGCALLFSANAYRRRESVTLLRT